MPKVLVGSQSERIEMAVAGSDELPPRYPIFVRPAVRPDPDYRPSRTVAALQAVDRALWGSRAPIGTVICIGIILAVIVSLVWQVLRGHGGAG